MVQLRKIALLLGMVLASGFVWGQKSKKSSQPDWDAINASIKGVASYVPKNGIVPDETTAIRLAETLLTPIYGEEKITSERPFYARLSNGTWTIVSSMLTANFGGVTIMKISQTDGHVIFVTHQM